MDTNFPGRGHRVNILNSAYQEIGVGQVTGDFQGSNASMLTEDFGVRGNQQFLTGVSYADTDHDSFYSVGEGRGSMLVAVAAAGNPSTSTGTAGGYSLAVNSGLQTVTFSGGGLASPINVSVSIAANTNAKVDVIDQGTIATSASLTDLGGATKIIGLGTFGLALTGDSGNDTIIGTKGNDTIDGAGGSDTVVFSGNFSAYTRTNLPNGSIQIAGPDGTDTLSNVEVLQFADQSIPVGGSADLTASNAVLNGATLSYRINNTGTGTTAASTAGIYLSSDSTITTADALLVTHATPALAGGASDLEAASLSFSTNLTPGTYFVGVIADHNGQIAESSETNNASSGVPIILGNNSANTLNGTAGNDTILGLGGDDTIDGGAGNDTIDGGAGINTAVYSGLHSDYLVTRLSPDSFQISDTRAGSPNGTDTVSSIQAFQFADQTSSTTVFTSHTFELSAFAPGAGGWTSDHQYPREVADVNGDHMADIVGFGADGVIVSLATGNGHFGALTTGIDNFGSSAAGGGWTSDNQYPRQLADVNGDHLADIVGFGADGVIVSLATGNGHFASPVAGIQNFGFLANGGGWTSEDQYPRQLADVNGDGMADIVGFGADGAIVSLATGNGHFAAPVAGIQNFGFLANGGGWTSQDQYPRLLADVNGDHMADIVGFGADGAIVSLATGNGHFASPVAGIQNFGFLANGGGWTSENQYPRQLADVNGDGMADIVGFGADGAIVSLATGNGHFASPVAGISNFGFLAAGGGWTSQDQYPRQLADVNGDGAADIIGFGHDGVFEALSNGFHLI